MLRRHGLIATYCKATRFEQLVDSLFFQRLRTLVAPQCWWKESLLRRSWKPCQETQSVLLQRNKESPESPSDRLCWAGNFRSPDVPLNAFNIFQPILLMIGFSFGLHSYISLPPLSRHNPEERLRWDGGNFKIFEVVCAIDGPVQQAWAASGSAKERDRESFE